MQMSGKDLPFTQGERQSPKEDRNQWLEAGDTLHKSWLNHK